MPHELLLLVVGLSYALVFRLLAALRRETFSYRFIAEAVGLTVLAAAFCFLTGIHLNPVFFLVFLYLITMRVRLLVDMANLAARSGRFELADRVFAAAWRLAPDAPGRLVIAMNQGAVRILAGRVAEAIPLLEEVLETEELSPKYAAATHYNLGVAYHKTGDGPQAIKHLSAAIEEFPNSVYARGAQALLQKRAKGEKPPEE
jgi:tetratricopeptide (TPR) repeat protein